MEKNVNREIRKIYDIKKGGFRGSVYIEYRYNNTGNNLIGRWSKYGIAAYDNPSSRQINCDFCVASTERRREKWRTLHDRSTAETPVHSYRVEGVTNAEDFYQWENGVCHNPAYCWGPDCEYVFDCWRQPLPKQPGLTMYKFTSRKYFDAREIFSAHLWIKVSRDSRYHTKYSGIGFQSQIVQWFWPDFLKKYSQSGAKYLVHVEMDSNLPPPPDFIQKCFNSRVYNFPTQMTFKHFIEDSTQTNPKTLDDLDDFHSLVGLTFIDVYPGASGCRIRQYCYLENDEHTPEWKMSNAELARRLWRDPSQQMGADWADADYVGNQAMFIPRIIDGFCGPFDVFYVKHNSINQWFSC